MTSTRVRWITAVGLILGLMATACGGNPPPVTLPPIVITLPPTPPTEPPPAPTPRATLAFQVVDEDTGVPIAAFSTCDDGIAKQANDEGYIAVEREVGIYNCKFEADDYHAVTRRYQLEANRQFVVRLKTTKPAPPPVKPEPPPVVLPPVVVPPPVVEPPPPPIHQICDRNGDGLTCVRTMAAVHIRLIQTNTYESCVEFTQLVLEQLGPEWGHVGKTRGEGQSVPKGFKELDVKGTDGNLYHITGVSHDAIKNRSTGQVVDLLANASANSDPDPNIHGPATPIWSLIPPEHWRVNNPFVPAVPVVR